ncbi:hypothetical protein FQN53_000719 [Emmonsiellopsis sp. PD_33]|nr:hypothetical protein FQN53_000719 [Emmonsiellopsis sp. PD_33]
MSRMSSLKDKFRSTSSSNPSKPQMSTPLRRNCSAGDLLNRTPSSGSTNSTPSSKHKTNLMSFLEHFSRSGGAPSSSPPPLTSPGDVLPQDPGRLEGILNYHLSQLDRIKRELADHNETIEQLSYTLTDIQGQDDMRHSTEKLRSRIQGVRNARNLLARYVAFHLQEIERIVALKCTMAGTKEMPNIFKHLPTDFEWNEMFSQ